MTRKAKKETNWYLIAVKGELGFSLSRAFTEKEARSWYESEGQIITHFRQISDAAGKAIISDPKTKIAVVTFGN